MYNQIPGTEAAAFKPRKPIVVLRQIGNLVYTSGHGPEDQSPASRFMPGESAAI